MANRLHILVVEDDFISRTLLAEMLFPFGDCQTASNGNEAVDLLRRSYERSEKRFDLVCLDIMMPGKNGHEVLRELRHIEGELGCYGQQATKVLMVTSLDDAQNILEALMVGRCEAYLTKPVSRNRLREHLHTLRLIEEAC